MIRFRSKLSAAAVSLGLMFWTGCGAPGHTVEGTFYGGTYSESQQAMQSYREAFDVGSIKLPKLPSSGKKLAVCYGTTEDLKNLSDTSGDPVRGQIFQIQAEGLVKCIATSGMFTVIDIVPSTVTLSDCRARGDDFRLDLTPHAPGVGEIVNTRTGERTTLTGTTIDTTTMPGSIETLERSFVGQVNVVVTQETTHTATAPAYTPAPAPNMK